MNAMPFDKVISPEQNILTHWGFQLAAQWTLRLREGGLLWAAVECSTWVFLSRGTYGRSKSRPEGDLDHAAVRIANRMAERTVMLCVLAASRGAKIVIENPQSSLVVVFVHPCLSSARWFWRSKLVCGSVPLAF